MSVSNLRGLVLRCAIGACAAVALTAGSASAAIMSATYEGTITSGVDEEGYFGAAGALMSGKSYAVTYIYDTTVGTYNGGPQGYGVQADLFFGQPLPLKSMSATINGNTLTVLPSDFDSTEGFGWTNYATDLLALGALYNSGVLNLYRPNFHFAFFSLLKTNDALPLDLDTPFTATGLDTGEALAQFLLPGGTSESALKTGDYLLTGSAAKLTVTRLDTPGAVPEPATWALMISGFGLAGASLRARRATRRQIA